MKRYLLNLESIAVYSNFYQGQEHAGVLQGELHFFVSQSPLTIMQNSFLEVGKDLEGSRKAARFLLNRTRQVPVALSIVNNIILIQCKAASTLGGEVYIVAKHIVDIQPYKTGQTLIHTTNGHALIVDMKPSKVQDIRDMATILQVTLLKNNEAQNKPINNNEKSCGYLLIREDGQINYNIKKKKK